MIKNVIIAGVGGQGTIFAGKILGTMAYQTGLHVKISEIHGMSQRGGSVVTQVRFGKHVYAPLAQAGEVDVLIALEELEALRYASYLKENGILLMCNCRIEPTASDGVYIRRVSAHSLNRNTTYIIWKKFHFGIRH